MSEPSAEQSMTQTAQPSSAPKALDVFTRRGGSTEPSGLTLADVIALLLSFIWLAGTGAFFILAPSEPGTLDGLRFVMTLLAVFLPVALIWVGATAVRTGRMMREDSARLQASIDAMRRTYLQAQATNQGIKPSVEAKLEEIAAAQRKTESALATFATIRTTVAEQGMAAPAIPAAPEPEGQASLALGSPAETLETPIDVDDFIKALNFPENAEDRDGFRALRRALADRQMSELVRSAQDILTMLSQDGIYMDDLRPDRTRPELWRKFAQGERGRAISGLGAVRDRTCLALTAARMREDDIFRDAAHHFLRRFDKIVSSFEENASDQDIAALSDTRTARAFMLLGRVTGTFA